MAFDTLRISSVVVLSLILSSCSDTTSPGESRGQPALTQRAHRQVAVELLRSAKLLNDPDGSLIVRLRARCPRGFQVVEGVVGVKQGPEFGEVHGEGYFTTRCSGHWQLQRVRVVAPEGLHPGRAEASASLDVENPKTGEIIGGSDNAILRIH
jgi:hypothetical protein